MKNIRHLCAGFLVIIIVIITLCSCSNDRSEPTNAVSPAGDVFHELTLPAVTEGQVSVLDARGSRILYVREEKLLSKDGGYAYYETKQVGIYDVDAQKSLAVWEPETPGNYFGGALLDGDAAILALQIDYTNAYPAQFAAMYFGGSQRSLVELTGELQWLLPFSGKKALSASTVSPLTAARMLCCCRLMRTPSRWAAILLSAATASAMPMPKMAKSPCAPSPPTARRTLSPCRSLRSWTRSG